MDIKFDYKKIVVVLLAILLFEAKSLLAFLHPEIGNFVFASAVVLTAFASLNNLEYGLWAALTELVIGSKGYLLSFSILNSVVSIRIGIWLVVMSIWLAKILLEFFSAAKKGDIKKTYIFTIQKFTSTKLVAGMFLFIVYGILVGLIKENEFSNIFFDANGWLYFSYFFPFSYVYLHKNSKLSINNLLNILVVGSFALSVKSFVVLYLFSHNFSNIIPVLYRWIRVTGVGEITSFQGGFYRVFSQSHIFILLMFFYLILSLASDKRPLRKKSMKVFLAVLFLSVTIMSLSRSNWVGLIFGSLIIFFIVFKKKTFFAGLRFIYQYLLLFLFSFFLIVAVVKFPLPNTSVSVDAGELIKNRVSSIAGEAGVSSRWSLLPVLKEKILQNPIFGSGFGTLATYKTSDPRVLEKTTDGLYTTYAFEWGWLDIWIKMGFFGFAFYLFLVGFIFLKNLKIIFLQNILINEFIFVSIASLSAIHFFSPYLNHPIGIGILIILLIFQEKTFLSNTKLT